MSIRSAALLFVFIFIVGLGNAYAESDPKQTLSEKLFIVHFETGAAWDTSLQPQQQNKFKEHSANLNRLRKLKIISFGARYGDLGVIFLRADSMDQAKSMIAEDPGVKSGIFNFRISSLNVFYPWQD